jgi:heme exporter protein A
MAVPQASPASTAPPTSSPGARPDDFTAVTIDRVSRHFGRRRALLRVTLGCRAGEVVGLLGPNGAGKSTLLSIVATLAAPSSGVVRYGSATAAEAGPGLRARIGVLAHESWLYPELTAAENLAFFAALHGLPDRRARVAAALDRAGLARRAGDAVSTFSRGMRQRLALERALIHEPRLVLLDEPFSGLDDAASAALVARLGELRRDGRITLMATHDLDLAARAIDRAAIFRDGRLVAVEPAGPRLADVYRERLTAPADAVEGGPRGAG